VVSDESGRLSRLVRSSTRRALLRRDRGCRFPGCDRPSGWSDAHHLVHWADGGETKLSNLVLLCRRHHRMVHEGKVPLRL
jgi:5-methylcytosine-specific restriction endonuclease McrA